MGFSPYSSFDWLFGAYNHTFPIFHAAECYNRLCQPSIFLFFSFPFNGHNIYITALYRFLSGSFYLWLSLWRISAVPFLELFLLLLPPPPLSLSQQETLTACRLSPFPIQFHLALLKQLFNAGI